MTLPNINNTKIDIHSNQYGSLTELDDVFVGQVTLDEQLPTSGVTCILTPKGATAGFDCRGGAPATHETDLLRSGNLVEKVQGIVLTGGSSFGLITALGAQQYMAEQNLGWRVGKAPEEVVPILPAAAIFDLGRSGSFTHRPTFELGYQAAECAKTGYVQEGSVGAGSGAEVGHYFGMPISGGVGTSCVHLDDGVLVGALVVVNAAGLPTESDGGRLLGRKYINNISLLNDLLPQIADPLEEEIASWNSHVSKAMLGKSKESKSESLTHSNTVIGVVATNAKLTRAELQKLAAISHDGLARCIWPIHTPFDGDSLFSLSTGQLEIEENREIWPDIMLRPQILSKIYECGATSVARATLRAVLTADAKREVPAYRSFFPSLYTL